MATTEPDREYGLEPSLERRESFERQEAAKTTPHPCLVRLLELAKSQVAPAAGKGPERDIVASSLVPVDRQPHADPKRAGAGADELDSSSSVDGAW